MKIPDNIEREHLLKAIEKIDKDGYDFHAESVRYDVSYNNKRYPPKLIVSIANLFANNSELNRNEFAGGPNTPAFNLLEKFGFDIVKKKDDGFFLTLLQFLAQANKEGLNLTTTNYTKEFNGLKVKVSFGKGNSARIPWIAFLGEGQEVSKGVYPVYLYFKEQQLLILAYGVSEENKPELSWNEVGKTVNNFFEDQLSSSPDRYGKSMVFSNYLINNNDRDFGLDEKTVKENLEKLIKVYKSMFNESVITPKSTVSEYFNYNDFIDAAAQSQYKLSDKLGLRFIASLLTKPFVILTGLSGSGKTKLAQAFAMWICENENQYCIVPVGADWTNREPLVGFPNALNSAEYVKPDNGVLDLIIMANRNSEKPYFLILDEMNLSHVERYFADFLSVMESNGQLSLHPGPGTKSDIPAKIHLPPNLFIIGTVNIDETTYMFSPKVLDRANVIEFRVTAEEMKGYFDNVNNKLDLDSLTSAGSDQAESFVEIARDKSLRTNNISDLQSALMLFFTELKKTGAEFGYRSASEVLRFAAVVNTINSDWKTNEITDAAIMQKLLPKVHGSRRKLEPILKTIGLLCLQKDEKFENFISQPDEFVVAGNEKINYPISFEKILRMYKGLLDNGFTSFAEA